MIVLGLLVQKPAGGGGGQAMGILGTLKPGVVALIRVVCILEWIRGIASFARME